MYECINLSKQNMDNLEILSAFNSNFNELNEDFLEFYLKCNFPQQVIARRKVKLLKNQEDYVGYIWFEHENKKNCIIKSMISKELNNIDDYKMLLSNIKGKSTIQYTCKSNETNSKIMDELGFFKNSGLLEMSLSNFNFDRDSYNEILNKQNINFRTFVKGRNENLRCTIQNQVFEDEDRSPLRVHDIYFDECQNYYLDFGGIFIYKGSKCAGYGQIILEKEYPYIVNVGVISEFRGLGYGKILMFKLLDLLSENKYNEVRLKVKENNYKALNLYKGLGFKEISEIYKWELKR